MSRKRFLLFSVIILFILAGCSTVTSTETTTTTSANTTSTTSSTSTTTTSTTTTTTTTSEVTTTMTLPIIDGIGSIEGIENVTLIRNHYFNPMKDVSVVSNWGKDITSLVSVEGSVDYGTLGLYTIWYNLSYGEDSFSVNRSIEVVDGTYVAPSGSRPTSGLSQVSLSEGSYRTGLATSIAHPVDPSFIEADLLSQAVPSNGWWTSLLVANYGGGNGIYINPLRTSFANAGMEITHSGEGFVQYWNPEGLQTIAQFSLSLKDLYLKTTDLSTGYTTKVIDYGDSNVKVAMRNTTSNEDKMVISLVQGSPYIFAEVANKNAPYITMDVNGVMGYEYFDLQGNIITSNTYTGDALILKMVQRHVGYNCTPPANVGQPMYADRYFLINAPASTLFTISSGGHPSGLLNKVSMSLGDGNYLSVASINNLSEAAFYHEHGYSFITDTNTDFEVDHESNLVNTTYSINYQQMRDDIISLPVLALLPHQYKHSNAVFTDYLFQTIRGRLKVMIGSSFDTVLPFYGIVPGFTIPEDETFSAQITVSYLEDLDSRTEIADLENFLNADGPYWNSKALYPLSQGVIIADQLGETVLRDKLLSKLVYLLSDWYTYSSIADPKYLYYNEKWGSVYYSDNEFGTAEALSDHSFTHGYLIYASAVVAMYIPEFINDYGDMVDLLLDDYMYPEKGNESFRYLRSFDPWAGHSWAHGFGTFAEGNNLESSSEAMNSWAAGYLWALATGDEARMDVAIYGFVTELSAIKEYWFDYDEDNWPDKYSDYAAVAGMIWGGKYDYATWFGANPTFIYGIQWLPTGEFLTNYALNDAEFDRLTTVFNTYLNAKSGVIDTWYSNMWAMKAIIDPAQALSIFNSSLILNDDYPSELVGSYWMVHALNSLNRRTTSVWMEINPYVSSTIYERADGTITAMVWNSTTESQLVTFRNAEGIVLLQSVPAGSFTRIDLP